MKNNLPKFTIREMLSSGVHYGHKKNRWNPQMSQFIYGAKEGVHIIDLTKTYVLLQEALQVVANVASNNGKILFIGTKKQLAGTIEKYAQDCNQYYVNHRWLGGMLTNWLTVSNSIKTLKNIETELDNEESKLTKKELLYLSKKHEKLNKSLGGIRELRNMPSLAIVFDTIKESNAILEVKKLGIPVIAVVDSNSSLNNINYPIPGNDDSAKSVGFFCDLFAKTIKSFGNYQSAKAEEPKAVEKLKVKEKVAVKAGDEKASEKAKGDDLEAKKAASKTAEKKAAPKTTEKKVATKKTAVKASEEKTAAKAESKSQEEK